MSDLDLANVIDQHIKNALSLGELTEDQADALDYYYGRPYGNEIEGQSQVVTREVLEVVEYAMPSLMRIFASERAVEFDPVGEEDIEQANQETDAVRHVAWKYSDGFTNTYNWCKDGILQKVGYAKVYVETKEETTSQRFEGLSDADLLQFPEDSIAELDRVDTETDIGLLTTYNAVVEITQTKKLPKWAPIEPEHVRVSKRVSGVCLDDADFVAQQEEYTQSDLIEMGFDKATVEALPTSTDNEDSQSVDYARASHTGETEDDDTWTERAMRPIEVWECYVRSDQDGDGIAELLKVMYAGNKVLRKEPVDFVPIIAWSPLPMPHQHAGLSLADLVTDLQKIKSTLMRQMLDNLYLTNNPEKEVVWDQVLEPADLMQSVPGGLKRVKSQGTITPLTVPFTAGASLPMIDIIDNEKEARSGIGRHTMGMDADTLAQSTKGAFMSALDQANGRLELIARHFAESGLKKLYLKLHALMVKEMDQELRMNLNGSFVPVSPSTWQRREDLTVKIGTGNASVEQRAMLARQVLDLQERVVQAGGLGRLVTEENIYNAATDFVDAIGKTNGDRYFTDSSQMPQQPPQPDMQMQLLQAQMQVEQMKAQVAQQKNEIDLMKAQADVELKRQQMALEARRQDQKLQLDAEENARDHAIEAQRVELERYKARLAEAEAELDKASDNDKVAMQKYVADLQSQTQILLKKMDVESQPEPVAVEPPAPSPPQEIHIHQGGKSRVVTLQRNDDGSLSGKTEEVD